jgi:prophage antirepressor-like protein
VLGIVQQSTATQSFGADEKGAHPSRTPGGIQKMAIVSESGLYKLIMRSDKPDARTIQDWITLKPLPAGRKGPGIWCRPLVADERVLEVSIPWLRGGCWSGHLRFKTVAWSSLPSRWTATGRITGAE